MGKLNDTTLTVCFFDATPKLVSFVLEPVMFCDILRSWRRHIRQQNLPLPTYVLGAKTHDIVAAHTPRAKHRQVSSGGDILT